MTDSPELALGLEQEGQYSRAANMYLRLAALATDRSKQFAYYHRAGINRRLEGAYGTSLALLDTARSLAPTLDDEYRVDRDIAMVLFDQGRLGDAWQLLDETNLNQLKLTSLSGDDARLERWRAIERRATLSFIARVDAMQGNLREALANYRSVDDAFALLHNECWVNDESDLAMTCAVYRLNNLIWWMKIMPTRWGRRIAKLPLAAWLALRTGYHRRAGEALVLATPYGSELYPRVREYLAR